MMYEASIVIPICDRTELLRATLLEYRNQSLSPNKYEFVIVDDGGTDESLIPMLQYFGETYHLNFHYLRTDISVLPFPIYQYQELLNDPGPALNIGIKNSQAPKVILTSPEIKPLHFDMLEKLVYWPLQPKEGVIADVWDPDLQMFISGGTEQRALHFLALFFKQDLLDTGGFDERFIGGWGYQDTEFRDRFAGPFGGRFIFTGQACRAWHQSHPRVEAFAHDGGVGFAKEIYEQLRGQAVANVGHAWGHRNLVTREIRGGEWKTV